MKFSEHYDVERRQEDDWFDVYLRVDSKLFVDPFLIYDNVSPFWSGAHDQILGFFEIVFGLVAESKGDERSLAWKKASRLLMFPEPAEFCLGMAEASPNGSGSGSGLQQGMLSGVKTALGLGIENVDHIETLVLFQGGMGVDRISDAVCNILKSRFIEYTQDVCRRHDIPMQEFRVRNARWSTEHARWADADVELPANPYFKNRPVLLVPKEFLKEMPIVTPEAFWRYAWANHSEALRGDFNYDIAKNVDRWTMARLARQNPDIVADYLSKMEATDHKPYPVDRDPKFLVRWYDVGAEIAARSPLAFLPASPEEFPQFVKAVLDAFTHYIEHQNGWEMLWESSGRPVTERKVQRMFHGAAINYCRANDVDLTGEANAGRGPVDFKFSKSWSARALVEMKLMSNSHFWDGILEQTKEYLIAEEIRVAYFVAVAFEDKDLDPKTTEKITRAAEIVARKHPDVEVRPMIIDARRQESASKLRADQDTRDELHRKTDTDTDTDSDSD
ncbi:hypothetical protein HDA40_003440 [Hamadaea flava]|uniref:Uncharacterized protein n=1 Tax=Hamadaea flava TaxID=1742688 RepID=A0ABV8LIX9_9ACTN|nr:hypothetical protein [Hamadaea flava]MCP2324933.1 hypothetical protein [Hamadaea flava]